MPNYDGRYSKEFATRADRDRDMERRLLRAKMDEYRAKYPGQHRSDERWLAAYYQLCKPTEPDEGFRLTRDLEAIATMEQIEREYATS